MGLLTDLFSGGAGKLVDSVGNMLDKVTTTKEEKLQLENEIKKAEMTYELEKQKLTVAEKQLFLQDVDSARKMASSVQTSENATKLAKNVSPILALGTTLLTFTLFFLLIFRRKDLETSGTENIVLYILGVLSAIVTQIFSFYFGSSQGSSDKNKMISDLQSKANAAQ